MPLSHGCERTEVSEPEGGDKSKSLEFGPPTPKKVHLSIVLSQLPYTKLYFYILARVQTLFFDVTEQLCYPNAGPEHCRPPPPEGKERSQVSQVGTCSCRWAASASWIRTSSRILAVRPHRHTSPLPPVGGDRDHVLKSKINHNTHQRIRITFTVLKS